ERLVVDHAAVEESRRLAEPPPLLELRVLRSLSLLLVAARVGDRHGGKGGGETGSDARQLGQRPEGHSRVYFFAGRAEERVEGLLAPRPVFELEDRTMVLHVNRVAGVIEDGGDVPVYVRARHKEVEFRDGRVEPDLVRVARLVLGHEAKGLFQPRLIV